MDKYAGLVPEISCDIDPSGRTDLLKILDEAKSVGHITIFASKMDFNEDAFLEINCDAVTIRSSKDPDDIFLIVPLHMLASVGFVKEEALNIVPLKIGEIDNSAEIYDLAVIYTKTTLIAEQICQYLGACFQYVYRESMNTLGLQDGNESRQKFSSAQSSSSTSSHFAERVSLSNFDGIDFATTMASNPGIYSAISTSTSSGSSKNTVELINDYLTMLSACLSHEELNKFAMLMKRWRAKEMPILEFAQKLMELYGMERKHLLARMKALLRGVSREELDSLSNFLRANGITENAASAYSPLWTAEMSFTDDANSPIFDNIRFFWKFYQ